MEAKEDAAREESTRKVRPRSFFTRKIEGKLEQKGTELPQQIISFLDQPFDLFNEEDKLFYEEKVKPLFDLFSELLLEVFDQMGRPEEGWEESTKLMQDCPAKVVAMLALYRYRRQAAVPDDPLQVLDQPPATPPPPQNRPAPSARTPVKKPAAPPSGQSKGKWWEKKIF